MAVDLSSLTDEELEAYESLLAKREAPKYPQVQPPAALTTTIPESPLSKTQRIARSLVPFGGGSQFTPSEETPEQAATAGYTPSPSLGNLARNVGRSVVETGQDIGHTLAHLPSSFMQDPIGTASTTAMVGSPLRLGYKGVTDPRFIPSMKAGAAEAAEGGLGRHTLPALAGGAISEALGHGFFPGMTAGAVIGKLPSFVRGFGNEWGGDLTSPFKIKPNILRKYELEKSSGTTAAPGTKGRSYEPRGKGTNIQEETPVEDPRSYNPNLARKLKVGKSRGEAPETETGRSKGTGPKGRKSEEKGSWSEKPIEGEGTEYETKTEPEIKVDKPRDVKGAFRSVAKEEARIDRDVSRGYEPSKFGGKIDTKVAQGLQDEARRIKATKMAQYIAKSDLDPHSLQYSRELSNSIADGAGVNRPRDNQSFLMAIEMAKKLKAKD
jgi:hypothetical protein